MRRAQTKTKILLLVLSITTGATLAYFFSHRTHVECAQSNYKRYIFNGDERDIKAVEDLFAQPENRYLLLAQTTPYDVRRMMTQRMSAYYDPSTIGDLTITIARDAQTDDFIGFTAHHKLSFYKYKLLFLAIDAQARSKGYGRALAQQALQDMKNTGALKAVLDVREENAKARSLYESLGFKKVSVDHGFVHYELDLQNWRRA